MAQRTPNVVVIMSDDLGFGDLSFYGFGATRTPHIDSIARQGAVLSQHYSSSPICAPARASFLTGRDPQRTGVIDTFPHRGLDALSLRERTIADDLKAAGYRTGLFGKWHNGATEAATHPNERGFDEFVGFRGGVQDYWDWLLERNGQGIPADGRYITDVLTDEAVGFVHRHAGDPFFLMVAYTAPHGPFQAPADYLARVTEGRPGEATVRETITAMVEAMDDGVGRLLDALEVTGVAEDTLVIFTSDNGPWMRPGSIAETTVRYNLGLAGGKELVLEGGIRVPLFVRWPGRVVPGTMIHTPVHFVDWVPTIHAATGAARTGALALDGLDVTTLLTGGHLDVDRTRQWQWSRYAPSGTVNAAIREGDWKLVYPATERALLILEEDRQEERRLRRDPSRYVPPPDGFRQPPPIVGGTESPRLYHLLRDPSETTDLAASEPGRTRRLAQQLQHWFTDVQAERMLALAHDRERGLNRDP